MSEQIYWHSGEHILSFSSNKQSVASGLGPREMTKCSCNVRWEHNIRYDGSMEVLDWDVKKLIKSR